jgi:hypothetical protein
MGWTYAGNPAASPVDEVHYRLGDVAPDNPIATDEECAFALCENGYNTYLAAASIAETKALTFLNRPQVTKIGERTTSYGMNPAQDFLMLARTLRQQASLKTTSIYVGGLSKMEKDSDRRETGLVQPAFTKDLHTSGRWRGTTDIERDSG